MIPKGAKNVPSLREARPKTVDSVNFEIDGYQLSVPLPPECLELKNHLEADTG